MALYSHKGGGRTLDFLNCELSLADRSKFGKWASIVIDMYIISDSEFAMFDEEKVKKDLEKMREAYEKAMKDIEEIEERQEEIAKKDLCYSRT